MLQLSLSWLGLGQLAISPWVLLLLVGATWLLTRVLAWSYSFYDIRRRLQCFPQPPKRNWFWGHVGLRRFRDATVSVSPGSSPARLLSGHICSHLGCDFAMSVV
uniref:Uncharacterized protein n=1 Tax=Canis lupus dingo TaxID=286419 RepID=A0A8C0K9E7_CANLU